MCFKISGKTAYQNNNWPYLSALSERLVMEVHEARSRCFSFGQNLLRLLHVLQKNNTVIKSVLWYVRYINRTAAWTVTIPVCDLGATVQIKHLNVPAVLWESPKEREREKEKKKHLCDISYSALLSLSPLRVWTSMRISIRRGPH